VKPGDLITVIYGTQPTFVLRQLPTPDTRTQLFGDAFVHGLMDLSETLKEAIGPTEWLTIT
jgi:hypothetical protein